MAVFWVDPAERNAVRHIVRGNDEQNGIFAHPPGTWENDEAHPRLYDWWAVSDDGGIFVYTDEEATADELREHFTRTARRETIEEHMARHGVGQCVS